MKCTDCDSTTINGVYCHETGCPAALCSVCKTRPAVAGVHCQRCLDNETLDMPNEDLEAAASLSPLAQQYKDWLNK